MTDFLQRIFDVIQSEARTNPDFYARLRAASGLEAPPSGSGRTLGASKRNEPRRHRRPKGLFDPMQLMKEGEHVLRERLAGLDVEELKDIVAEHGMDTTKLAMKWRSRDRLTDLILATTRDRLSKGEAFLSKRDANGNPIIS